METKTNPKVTIEVLVNAPVEKVWESWTQPEHIMNWNQASEDWHTPYAESDLQENGKFKSTMAAKDGSMSFDFEGVFDVVEKHSRIEYTMTDGRKVKVLFDPQGNGVNVTEIFEAEATNPVELQRNGWQAILNSFKKYTENL